MKPLLLIDIDGPLNPYLALSRPGTPDGYHMHLMRPSGWTEGPALPVLLSPGHGGALLALAERYELAWASTWMAEANEWIAPPLGLPPLPYIEWPTLLGSAPDGVYWKTRHVVDYAAGRPFAWIDDEITERDRTWVAAHHPSRWMLRRIDPWTGLEEADFDALAAWAGD
ncbi:hypothetical protein F0344_30700 [Streptomyces finlayi]|uniref:Secreted protein n=1 Tax=Streptomyces finlayi TaxID=67296 RepID=A0A7G7BST0_9ACTN|nr:hypothetical protein [Streptomyces finlayi]QNE78395.1 hypothetical protein F0344_30700 [Streptomyces finlayi]